MYGEFPCIITNHKLTDEECRAYDIINRLNECENASVLANILDEILTNVVYNQNKNIVGIINDYEYTVDLDVELE